MFALRARFRRNFMGGYGIASAAGDENGEGGCGCAGDHDGHHGEGYSG